MEHFANHPHAFLDSNNVVFLVGAFKDHDHEVVEAMKQNLNATAFACCCELGESLGENYELYGNIYFSPKPYPSWIRGVSAWEAPVPKPEDDKVYEWNEESISWIEVVPISE